MKTERFKTPEELVGYVEKCFGEREYAAARDAVATVSSHFPDSVLANHLAGLVWERSYLEASAEGLAPDLELYERAEQHYRRAMELDPDNPDFHSSRLYTCLFVLGTQRHDEARLREALHFSISLKHSADETARAHYERESAIVAAAIANLTQQVSDYDQAERLFAEAPEPPGGREGFFFHFYRGVLKRAIGQARESEHHLREAAASLAKARELNPGGAIEYLLADCLAQLQHPNAREAGLMDDLVPQLYHDNPKDALISSLYERWKIRRQLRESEEEEGKQSHDPGN